MRKRRSIAFVQPGKDVTLYVPTGTPPEVIEYLNQLKADGTFSQGVMEIVTHYVMNQRSHSNSVQPMSAEFADPPVHDDDYLEERVRRESIPAQRDKTNLLPESTHKQVEGAHQKLDRAQIFRQAQRNAGKMNLDYGQ